MVIRKGLHTYLTPLALYAAASLIVGYFFYHAHNGERGLEAKRELKLLQFKLSAELEALRTERADWEKRVVLLRPEAVDRDMLDEQARHLLNRVHRNDVVIILGQFGSTR